MKKYCFIMMISFIVLLASCSSSKKEEDSVAVETDIQKPIEIMNYGTNLPQIPDHFQQMLLYVQMGFLDYGIEDTYEVYFRAPDDEAGMQEMILDGENGCWYELLRYEYDEEKDWYTFYSGYEPIFTRDKQEAEKEQLAVKAQIISEAVFQAVISADQRIDAAIIC